MRVNKVCAIKNILIILLEGIIHFESQRKTNSAFDRVIRSNCISDCSKNENLHFVLAVIMARRPVGVARE